MRHRAPNLFIIGSMKSGTTSLCRLLGAHPAVFMCPVKEPCYFADPGVLKTVWRARWRDGHWRNLDHYLSLFAAAGDVPYRAEASTVYSQVPVFSGVPERILASSPEAKFIYIMRDPIERTISHYLHVVRWWGERRDILSAIRFDPHYQDVSHYARQLRAYLRHVDAHRIYTLTLESLVAQPREQYRALCSWLGIDPDFDPGHFGERCNQTPEDIERVRGLGTLHRLRCSRTYGSIKSLVPKPLRNLGSRLAAKPFKLARASVGEVAQYLRLTQQKQTEELRDLLGRDFPEWKTLYGAPESDVVSSRRSMIVPDLVLD